MTALRIVLGLVAWIVAAVPVAVVIGIAIAHADRQRAEAQRRHPSGRARGAA